MAKPANNLAVRRNEIKRICQELSCDVGILIEVIPDDKKDKMDRLKY